ncbi:MAG TPA: response regulator transcription factor [Edaphobacter sp.]|nr:response regulator transcription factor [Edaphobacter sp.]
MESGSPSRSVESIHVLVVEDERKLAVAISEGLCQGGHRVTIAFTGEAALRVLSEKPVDIIVLDVMLPKIGGLETLREMRRQGFKVPVLLLTSKGLVEDRVRGLDAGADDYLVKPFAFPELLARIRALHRRIAPSLPTRISLDDLNMDLNGRIVERRGRLLDLTEREFDLLEYLMLNKGTVVSREMVARDVWKSEVRYTSLDNVIDVHIARIRRKLDDPFERKLLHTVRGVGFVMRPGEE